MKERKHDIVKDAYYLISKFLEEDKIITNLRAKIDVFF